MKIEKEYFITKDSMMISPKCDGNGNVHSIVKEVLGSFEVDHKPLSIIDESCSYYGSSFEGRKDGTKRMTSYRNKVPLCISEYLNIFFFPLESSENDTCIWLSYYHVEKVIAVGTAESLIVFSNGETVQVPYSKGSIEGNLERTAHYRSMLLRRLKQDR